MTTTTQRDIIRQITPVFSVDVCPLNNPRSITVFTTVSTLIRLAKFSSHPHMQATVTNIVSLPGIVFFIRNFISLALGPLFRSLISGYELSKFVSHEMYCSYKFGKTQLC